ncbi:hypothetical protein ACRU3B_09080 [Mycobacterium colombiense]|uniref:hypothetical protein n=1 Tax=Mycobacterium colombiense TaxID=339268 RepID=UPI00030D9A5A
MLTLDDERSFGYRYPSPRGLPAPAATKQAVGAAFCHRHIDIATAADSGVPRDSLYGVAYSVQKARIDTCPGVDQVAFSDSVIS